MSGPAARSGAMKDDSSPDRDEFSDVRVEASRTDESSSESEDDEEDEEEATGGMVTSEG